MFLVHERQNFKVQENSILFHEKDQTESSSEYFVKFLRKKKNFKKLNRKV